METGWFVSFSLSDLAPSTELHCWNIQVRGFCPVAFLACRVGDRWGGFSFVVALLLFEAFVTEHVREIRKNSETVHMQIPSITYL